MVDTCTAREVTSREQSGDWTLETTLFLLLFIIWMRKKEKIKIKIKSGSSGE